MKVKWVLDQQRGQQGDQAVNQLPCNLYEFLTRKGESCQKGSPMFKQIVREVRLIYRKERCILEKSGFLTEDFILYGEKSNYYFRKTIGLNHDGHDVVELVLWDERPTTIFRLISLEFK